MTNARWSGDKRRVLTQHAPIPPSKFAELVPADYPCYDISIIQNGHVTRFGHRRQKKVPLYYPSRPSVETGKATRCVKSSSRRRHVNFH